MIARAQLRPLPGDEEVPSDRGTLSLAQRLWPKVAGPWYSTPECPIGPDDCWPWIGRARAGVYRIRNGKRVRVAPSDLDYGRERCGPGAPPVVRAEGQLMARTIYLLHFDRPFSHARHYMGSAEDLDMRLAEEVERLRSDNRRLRQGGRRLPRRALEAVR